MGKTETHDKRQQIGKYYSAIFEFLNIIDPHPFKMSLTDFHNFNNPII